MIQYHPEVSTSSSRERVLVLGGSGFVGSAIIGRLAALGHKVTSVSRRAPTRPIEGVEYLALDAMHLREHPELLASADAIVYSIASLLPAESNRQPMRDTVESLSPLVGLLEALRGRDDTRLVFLSSGGTVYGVPTLLPIPENHPTDPLTSYGIMKLAAEKYLGMYAELYGLDVKILRISNAYGPLQPTGRGQGVIGEFVHAHAHSRPVRVFGTGRSIRDYIYVDDVADAVARTLHVEAPRVLNVGSGEGISLIQILEMLESITGRAVEIAFEEARGFDIESVILDASAFLALSGSDLTPFATGLTRTWDAEIESLSLGGA